MDKKIIFFDIDGTLWDGEHNYKVPESTIDTIKRLKENGHMVFINTGRAMGHISDTGLVELDFDGIVCACGTMIVIDGEIVFSHEIDNELMSYTYEVLRSENAHIILEGKNYLYVDMEYFEKDAYGHRLIRALGEHLRTVDDCMNNWEINKMSLVVEDCDMDVLHAKLDEYYSFMQHTPDVCELVPVGYDKGTGILKVCEILGVPVENTYAFGDSINDKEMMMVAGHPISMGNGTDEIKALCEYITAGVYEDGIQKACEYYELI